MKVLDLFSAAAGGWSLGMHRAGFQTVGACEREEWRRILYAENNPGVLLYDDVCTLTADRLVRDLGYFPDVVVGSPPCQDISSANTKGQGVDGERSGLFFEAIRIVGEGRPRWVALENSANLRTKGADRVLAALEDLDYACWPVVVRAGHGRGGAGIGANHERPRAWVLGFDTRQLADADGHGWSEGRGWGWSGLDLPVPHDPEHAASVGHEGGRSRRHGADGDGTSPAAPGRDDDGHAADRRGSRRQGRRVEPASGIPVKTCWDAISPHADHERQPDGAEHDEVGGGASLGGDAPRAWAEWNGGLAHHLRVDDGLSAWLAGARVAVGGSRGTAATALVVEAFGDSVVPQITEAIGRAILRTEAALASIYAERLAA